jgi:hypothetical protein
VLKPGLVWLWVTEGTKFLLKYYGLSIKQVNVHFKIPQVFGSLYPRIVRNSSPRASNITAQILSPSNSNHSSAFCK